MSTTIALDTSANVASGVDSGGLSGNFTATGSNILIIGVAYGDSGVNSVTNMTWNGVAMTHLTSVICPGDRAIDVWYVLAATSGTHTLAVTGTHLYQLSAVSFTGVGGIGTAVTNTGSSVSTLTTSITSNTANWWAVILSKDNGFGTVSGGANTTFDRTNQNLEILHTTTATASPGSISLIINGTLSGSIGAVMVGMSPQIDTVATVSDTAGSSDTFQTGITATYSDTQASSDSVSRQTTWKNQSKNSVTWSDVTKN